MRPSGGGSRRYVHRHPPRPSCTTPSPPLPAVGSTSTTAPNPEPSTKSRQFLLGLVFATQKKKKLQTPSTKGGSGRARLTGVLKRSTTTSHCMKA
jgi:hypothetical protein